MNHRSFVRLIFTGKAMPFYGLIFKLMVYISRKKCNVALCFSRMLRVSSQVNIELPGDYCDIRFLGCSSSLTLIKCAALRWTNKGL